MVTYSYFYTKYFKTPLTVSLICMETPECYCLPASRGSCVVAPPAILPVLLTASINKE